MPFTSVVIRPTTYHAERLVNANIGIVGRVLGRGSDPAVTSVVLRRNLVVDHAKDGIAVLHASGEGLLDDGTGLLGGTALRLLGGNVAVIGGGGGGGGGNSRFLALEDPVAAAAHLLGGTTVVGVRRGTGLHLDATCIVRAWRQRRRTRVPRTHNRLAFWFDGEKEIRCALLTNIYKEPSAIRCMLTRRVHNAAAYIYSPSLAMPAMALVDVVVFVVVVIVLSSSIEDTGKLVASATTAAKKGEEATSAVRALWRRMVQEERYKGEERAMLCRLGTVLCDLA